MKNRLPKYYAIKIDNSHPLMDIVWEHFNELCKNSGEPMWDCVENYNYIGYDGNDTQKCGTYKHDNLYRFKNNPTLLSIDEFVSMLENYSNDDYSIF